MKYPDFSTFGSMLDPTVMQTATVKSEVRQRKDGSYFHHDTRPEGMPTPVDIAEKYLYAPARRMCEELIGKNIPAKDLTDEQKSAIFLLAGFMRYENGRLVSIRPVGICDDGNGKYIVAIAPPEN